MDALFGASKEGDRMKIQGVMRDAELSVSAPYDNRVVFEIFTPIGKIIYDSDNYLQYKKITEGIEQFGISLEDFERLKFNDVHNIVFDIDISAHVKE